MSIHIGKGTFHASPRFVYGPNKIRVTEEQRKVVVAQLAELIPGGVGKGKRYRYISNYSFKTRAKAEKFWLPKLAAIGISDLVEICESFPLYF